MFAELNQSKMLIAFGIFLVQNYSPKLRFLQQHPLKGSSKLLVTKICILHSRISMVALDECASYIAHSYRACVRYWSKLSVSQLKGLFHEFYEPLATTGTRIIGQALGKTSGAKRFENLFTIPYTFSCYVILNSFSNFPLLP